MPVSPPMISAAGITRDEVRRTLGRDVGVRMLLPVTYQHALYRSLAGVWPGPGLRVLDVGCGAGRVASGYRELLGSKLVVGVDVANRFAPELAIACLRFDGVRLPFRDGAFDVVSLVNVLHHVSPARREALLIECARVVAGGPIIVKDHVVHYRGDRIRLLLLDILGNLPSGGMVKAAYLTEEEMIGLFQRIGYVRIAKAGEVFRRGIMGAVFPNRLEQTSVFVLSPVGMQDAGVESRDG